LDVSNLHQTQACAGLLSGGKIHTAWFAFGDYDVVVITETPNNVNAARSPLPSPREARARPFKLRR
jgi:uncharacterized protein with GYD domain